MENEENSESDEADFVPLTAKRTVNQSETQTTTKTNVTEPHGSNSGASIELGRQVTSSGGQQMETTTILPSNYETATDYTRAREAEIETNRKKNKKAQENPKETERDDAEPQKVSEIPQVGKKRE